MPSKWQGGHPLYKCVYCREPMPKGRPGLRVAEICPRCKAQELNAATVYDRERGIGDLPPNLRAYGAELPRPAQMTRSGRFQSAAR